MWRLDSPKPTPFAYIESMSNSCYLKLQYLEREARQRPTGFHVGPLDLDRIGI